MDAKVKIEKISEKEYKIIVETEEGKKIELSLSNFDEQFLSYLVSKLDKPISTNDKGKDEEGVNLLCNLIGCVNN